jgi:hypothetical protein
MHRGLALQRLSVARRGDLQKDAERMLNPVLS